MTTRIKFHIYKMTFQGLFASIYMIVVGLVFILERIFEEKIISNLPLSVIVSGIMTVMDFPLGLLHYLWSGFQVRNISDFIVFIICLVANAYFWGYVFKSYKDRKMKRVAHGVQQD